MQRNIRDYPHQRDGDCRAGQNRVYVGNSLKRGAGETVATRLDRSLISGFGLFEGLSPEELDAVLATARPRRLPAGSPAFAQGETATEFFVLLNGRIQVHQTAPDGSEIIVRHINPGELFGIAKAMRRPDYPATAMAVEESLALVWPESYWDTFVANNPAFARGAIETLGKRLQDADARVRELSTEEVERRIAHAILRLIDQAGRKVGDEVQITFPITREDIAQMAGTTLHTVSRVMSAWETAGLIASGRQKVSVRDPHRLFLLAEGKIRLPR
jgi:CRP/FNR family transcriptional regulator, nitrogen oxide reductase regulator